jgi:Arc/MetJ-type ribon-helix-helix transcriptional regulator
MRRAPRHDDVCVSDSRAWAPRRDVITLRGTLSAARVTIALRTAQLEKVRALVERGTVASVSGFVQHAVDLSFQNVDGWAAWLTQALDANQSVISSDPDDLYRLDPTLNVISV